MDAINQILSLLGNPAQILGLMPHPVIWPTLIQDTLRAYQAYAIAYYLGIFLLLLGILSGLLSYMSGLKGGGVFLNMFIMGSLWLTLTAPPQNDCLPDTGYPCVVAKSVSLENPTTDKITFAKETLDFSGVIPNGTVYKINDKDRNLTVKESYINLPPRVVYTYENPLPSIWSVIEGLWWHSATTANTALVSSLAKYQDGIDQARNQLMTLATAAFALNATASFGDALLRQAMFFLGTKWPRRPGLASLFVGGVSQAGSTGLAIVTETFKALAVALALTPLAIILTYGFIVAASGFVFYIAVFLFPIFVGLGALFGLRPILIPLQLMLVSILVPIIVSPYGDQSPHGIRLQRILAPVHRNQRR